MLITAPHAKLGTMQNLLASIYSFGDMLKRTLRARAADPAGDLVQTLGRANDDAKAFREIQ